MANYWTPIDTSIAFPLCSAEYRHACSGFLGVPIGGSAYYEYARTGKAMMLCEMYANAEIPVTAYSRDYAQGRFIKPLTVRKIYCITFYVNLVEMSGYAINQIGAYIDNGSIDAGQDSAVCAALQISFIPQIVETSIIIDTLNWVKYKEVLSERELRHSLLLVISRTYIM